jgi:hypothetical protein
VQLHEKAQATLCRLKQGGAPPQREVRPVSALFKPLLSPYPNSHHARYLYRKTYPEYREASHSYRPRYSERVVTSVGPTVGWRWRSQSSFDPRKCRSVHSMYDNSWAGSTDRALSYHRRQVAHAKRTAADSFAYRTRRPRRHHLRGEYYRPRYIDRKPLYTTQRGHSERRVGRSQYSCIVQYH